jgi:FkbM family methyltransferase
MLTRQNYINRPVEIEFELLHLFRSTDALIIFDIGACEAEDSIRYSMLFPKALVYAFEPRDDNCNKAIELIHQYKTSRIIVENLALSNISGKTMFYLSEGEPSDVKNTEHWDYGNKSSSLLPPSEEIKKHTDWLNFTTKIEVETMRLEEYVKKNRIETIDFAHIDVQGAELLVLEGAGEFLRTIKLIWLEVAAVELYTNQPLKDDIELFMKKHNFVKILDTVTGVAGDQLYANKLMFSEKQLKSARGGMARKISTSFMSRIKHCL